MINAHEYPQLELRQLRVLVALVEEGTFTDAAIRVSTTQSAVSRSIARLEAVVGARLIERTTRTVALTPAGSEFYRQVQSVLRGLDDAVSSARGQVRPLRLGYAWAAFGRFTSAILREWRSAHPDVPLEVHRIDERSAGLSRGRVDVAVIRGAVTDPEFAAELLTRESRLAALPVGHRLADRGAIDITDFADDPVALIPSIGTTRLDLWPTQAQPVGAIEMDNIDEWLTAIASGAAVGMTPESTQYQHGHAGVVYVPLRNVPTVDVHLAWPRTHPHPSTDGFVALVRAHVDRGTPVLQGSAREQENRAPGGPARVGSSLPNRTTFEVQKPLE